MLRYLAEASKRSLVLAVEEPESFLHPTAQQTIRGDLEALDEHDDVTLMITTHSPFVVSSGAAGGSLHDPEGRGRGVELLAGGR